MSSREGHHAEPIRPSEDAKVEDVCGGGSDDEYDRDMQDEERIVLGDEEYRAHVQRPEAEGDSDGEEPLAKKEATNVKTPRREDIIEH